MMCSVHRSPTRLCSCEPKYSSKARVSAVVPDLLEAMNTVRERSPTSSTRRICAGSVASRTINSRPPGATPNTSLSTSGARLLPPIPTRTARSIRRSASSSASALRRGTSTRIVSGRSSQPSRYSISAMTAGSLLHRLPFLAQNIRDAAFSDSSLRVCVAPCIESPRSSI